MPLNVSAIPAAEAVTTGMFGPTGSPGVPASQADKDMFLQLLVAQMRYQDPMNPTDSSEFLSQSAQFTALEKMQDVADQTAALFSAQIAFGASGLIGKQVTWNDSEGVAQSGSVKGVTFGVNGPVLDVSGAEVPIASVISVTDTPTSPAS